MKYSILVQYDDSDRIYVASIPDLQGCMAELPDLVCIYLQL